MRIRTFVTAALAAVALGAGTANAETALSYYINGHVDWTQLDDSAGDDDRTDLGVNGAVAFAVSDNWGVQVDAEATFVDDDVSSDDVYSGTVHAFHRTASGLIGGFVGVQNVDDDTAVGGGVEAAKYYADWTLGGSVTYANFDDADADLWALDVYGNYFYTDNLDVEVGVGFGKTDSDVGGDDDFWNARLAVGYQLDSVPVAFNAGVGYISNDDDDATALTVGVSYVFSGESRKARNRSGASQSGFLSSLGGLIS